MTLVGDLAAGFDRQHIRRQARNRLEHGSILTP
jgi:hypothetical protein